jgi:hypothetical protein
MEIALMIEAASTSETLVNFYQTTWRNNPEDSNLQGWKCLRKMKDKNNNVYITCSLHKSFCA